MEVEKIITGVCVVLSLVAIGLSISILLKNKDKFTNCHNIGLEVETDKKLLHHLYNTGQLTESSKLIRGDAWKVGPYVGSEFRASKRTHKEEYPAVPQSVCKCAENAYDPNPYGDCSQYAGTSNGDPYCQQYYDKNYCMCTAGGGINADCSEAQKTDGKWTCGE